MAVQNNNGDKKKNTYRQAGLNNFTGLGRLVMDPIYTDTKYGPLCKFTIAIGRMSNDPIANRRADFVLCQCWKEAAKTVFEYGRKGALIGVQGELFSFSMKKPNGQYEKICIVNCFKAVLYEYRGNKRTPEDVEKINTGYLDPGNLPF